ncbi:hypothetical protein HY995_02775 [Candidatus Micrarchaeota archaeon]|nr:hypothetical protein [Candidatus Micrarchaeota archaeon]MBI5176986.1 hypothetical protein [Candidatus Micrarchaeota archaeon]
MEAEFVSVDRFGRVLLPKKLRESFQTSSFIAEKRGEELLFKPVPTFKEMFGSMPKLDLKKFAKQHQEGLDE